MIKEQITFDDFDKVDIRVGTVISVKKNEKARKPSLVVEVDFGSKIGIKQSSAQITHYYNEENLKDGEALYGMFCQHCHGATGAGDGSVQHPIYSAVPHYNDSKLLRRCGVPMCDLEAGHIFHAITYGLNAMGPHASQITEEERWKIVLYVQEKLQK